MYLLHTHINDITNLMALTELCSIIAATPAGSFAQ